MYRILKKSGAERVSDESADELRRIIEEIAEDIAKNAVDMASHAGRKTIKAEDVKTKRNDSFKKLNRQKCTFLEGSFFGRCRRY